MTLSTIDSSRLSDKAIVVIQQIALPLSWGYSVEEIAAWHGQEPSWVSGLLSDLRRELRDGNSTR